MRRQPRGHGPVPRRPVVPALLAAVAAAAVALGACTAGPPSDRTGATPAATAAATTSGGGRSTSPSGSAAASGVPSAGTPASSAAAAGPAVSACASATLATLSDAQRVGQLFLVGVPLDDAALRPVAVSNAAALAAGGYLLYGRSDAGLAATRSLTQDVSGQLARRSAAVAPFVAVDQEGGTIQTLSGSGFSTIPSALRQGAMPVATLRSAARSWGDQLRQAGVNIDLAPVLDVVPADLARSNQPIGRYDRELGHTPDVVASHGVAVVEGLRLAGVAATAKHFPGLGRVSGNPDVETGVTDPVTTTTDPSLQPFRAAVAAGVPVVMMSTAVYPRIDPHQPAAFSPAAVRLLRDGLGFSGLVAADDLGQAAQVRPVPAGQRALRFLAAGGQLMVVVKPPAVARGMADAVLAAVATDPAVRQQVAAAAAQVLDTKVRYGLLTCR